MPALRVMPRANRGDPANPLISGATGSISERRFARLRRFLGLGLQGTIAVSAADVLDPPHETS